MRYPLDQNLYQALRFPDESIERAGACYRLSRTEFVDVNNLEELVATELTATIEPGERIDLAYWPAAAPVKLLQVQQGLGEIVLARSDSNRIESRELEATSRQIFPLVPDRFYAIQAAKSSEDSLVVTTLQGHDADPLGQWADLGVTFSPQAASIIVGAHKLRIPTAFVELFRD